MTLFLENIGEDVSGSAPGPDLVMVAIFLVLCKQLCD